MPEDFQNKPKRLRNATSNRIQFRFDERNIDAVATDSVAAALIGAGIKTFRTTTVNTKPRGPFCMMGICFDCLVEIDGVPNQQACMTAVRAGMQVKRMHGARRADLSTLSNNPTTVSEDK